MNSDHLKNLIIADQLEDGFKDLSILGCNRIEDGLASLLRCDDLTIFELAQVLRQTLGQPDHRQLA